MSKYSFIKKYICGMVVMMIMLCLCSCSSASPEELILGDWYYASAETGYGYQLTFYEDGDYKEGRRSGVWNIVSQDGENILKMKETYASSFSTYKIVALSKDKLTIMDGGAEKSFTRSLEEVEKIREEYKERVRNNMNNQSGN